MSSFSSLKDQYDNFMAPAYKITSGGEELVRSEFLVTDIAVDNSVGAEAGICRFSVVGVYERGSRQISDSAIKMLTPGSAVSISLGYGSELSEVFTGYIDETCLRFNNSEISLTAYCMDARALMRQGALYATGKEQSMSDLAGALLDKYSPLISSKEVSLDVLEQDVSVTQAGSDLSFIINAADLRGMYFFIDCGKAVIGEAKDSVSVEFDWEEFGIEFSVKYLDTELTGGGYDHMKMEAFSATASAKQTAKQEDMLTVSRMVQLPFHLLGDSGQKVLDAQGAALTRESVGGVITCKGIPEPKLGEKIKINKFPLEAIGVGSEFTIVSVGHRMSAEDGYYTEIGIEG